MNIREEPEVMTYVGPTDNDVLFGRGGATYRHPGNQRYRELITRLRPHYQGVMNHEEKTRLSQEVVHFVHSLGGRFLGKDGQGQWFIVHDHVARLKTSQALREAART